MTICTQHRVNYFGEMKGTQIQLNHIGKIATDCWLDIPEHFHNTALDEFVVMPNHIHGIVVIKGNDLVGNNDRCSLLKNRNMQALPKIISQYKSSTTRIIRKQYANHPFGWQKSFYDHVIRDEPSLHDIREYIHNNPLNWELDENNPRNGITPKLGP